MTDPQTGTISQGFLDRLKAEIKFILIQRAKIRGMITYSELAESITITQIGPRDKILYQILDIISAEEDAAGRGMLSCIVVHKSGDMEPGVGFYELAERLGKKRRRKLELWVKELHRVHAACQRPQNYPPVKLQPPT